MVLGLTWLVVNYLAGDKIGFMVALAGMAAGSTTTSWWAS